MCNQPVRSEYPYCRTEQKCQGSEQSEFKRGKCRVVRIHFQCSELGKDHGQISESQRLAIAPEARRVGRLYEYGALLDSDLR
ncbi:hypothetical protein D3C81_740470 [compost metagenome]